MAYTQHQYLLKRQPVDERDKKFAVERIHMALPSKVDLRSKLPPVFDQGALGSCTANAGIASLMALRGTSELYSRLHLYYKERELEGTTDEDCGACMRSIGKALKKFGACPEPFWPYLVERYADPPTTAANAAAAQNVIRKYRSVPSFETAKALLARGQTVMFGMDVYPSFEQTDEDGIVQPVGSGEPLLGGHAQLFAGYDDHFGKKASGILSDFISAVFGSNTKKETFWLGRGSWDEDWAMGGYFWMPESYARAYCYDQWTLEA